MRSSTVRTPIPVVALPILTDDSLGLTASLGCELAVSAFGACVWYLRKCKIDHEIVSLKRFEVYRPIDAEVRASQEEVDHYISTRQHMVRT